jgi:hypothetical protein
MWKPVKLLCILSIFFNVFVYIKIYASIGHLINIDNIYQFYLVFLYWQKSCLQ